MRKTLTLITFVLAAQPVAAACIDEAAFVAVGGKLVSKSPPGIFDLPEDFRCADCRGGALFSWVVDEQGHVRDLTVLKSNWNIKPDWHLRVLREQTAQRRYAPPVLDGRPVCVRRLWPMLFGIPSIDYRIPPIHHP
ncbi:MAG TPA: hypothetical protein VHZ29_04280 [Rhizomicrobium sp.]|jgi:hypothetical protein|nr:hypothetical protein [Rhizomicrobium sp.]